MSSDRAQLAHAARSYVQAGWPILPVAPEGDRLAAGMSPSDTQTVDDWWGERPYGIGCRTGVVFDALSIPVAVGPAALRRLRGLSTRGAVIDRGTREWLCLVSPGARMIPELRIASRLYSTTAASWVPRLYGFGDWITLPPTTHAAGNVSWISEDSQLPHSLNAQWALVRALQRYVGAGSEA